MRVIKLNKDADIAQAIKTVRSLKDDGVVFELAKGSLLLSNSSNLKLLKKTGEALGKTVLVRTNDPMGKALALKAEVLEGAVEIKKPAARVKRSDIKPRFSDIMIPRQQLPNSMKKLQQVEEREALPKIAAVKAEKKSRKFRFPNFRRSFTKFFIIGMVVLILIVFGLAVLLPSATITVYARSEPITRDVEITVNKSATAADAAKLVVPAVAVAREVTVTKNFPTTGTKLVGTKATGSVTMYNFTTNTLTLKAATTTLVANGKKFAFKSDVTGLRPTARIGSGDTEQIDQTSLIPPVPVVALDVGEDFNLAAGTKFTVQNAALGNTPNVIAANDQAFAGGSSHPVQVLSQADLDKAAASLSDGVVDQAQQDLNAENSSSDIKILSEALTKEVLAKTANKNVNDEAADFDMTMIAKISGIAYHEEDVKNIITQQIQSVLSDDKYLLPGAQETINAKFKSIDLAAGSGVLSVHFETVAAYKVNETNMSKKLEGKSATEIKEILLSYPEVDRVDIEFSPFFVNKAPRLNGKIYIHTVLSQT